MKLKSKLIATISAFCLVCVMMVVGVWALKSTSFEIGGKISFSATGVNATISDGVLLNATHKTADDATEKLKLFKIKVGETQTEIDQNSEGWGNLDLLFDEDGENATITFTITNDNEDLDKYLNVSVGVTQGEVNNAKVEVSPTSALIQPTKSQEFVVIFSVEKKDFDASLDGFKLSFDLKHEKIPTQSDCSYLSFRTYGTGLALTNVTDTSLTSLEVPSQIIYEGAVKQIVAIGYNNTSPFTNCKNLKNITIGEYVTLIFANITNNLDSITFKSVKPPTIMSENAFQNTSAIFVPEGSVDEYKTTYSAYSNIIYAIGTVI